MSIAHTAIGDGSYDAPKSADIDIRKLMLKYLGVSEDEVLTHYSILRLAEGVSDPDAIDRAATRQLNSLEPLKLKNGMRSVLDKLSRQITMAKLTLLDDEKRERYNAELLAKKLKPVDVAPTRERVARVLPMAIPLPSPQALPVISAPTREEVPLTLTNASLAPSTAPASTTIGSIQQHWKYLAAGAVVAVSGAMGAIWASSGPEKEKTEDVVAKAPELPASEPVLPAPPVQPNIVRAPAVQPNPQPVNIAAPAINTPVTFPRPAFVQTGTSQQSPVSNPRLAETIVPPTPIKPSDVQVAQIAPAQQAPIFDEQEYKNNREKLLLSVQGKKGAEQIDEIITLHANNTDIMKDPEMAKAVLVQIFKVSLEIKDLRRAYVGVHGLLSRNDLALSKIEEDYIAAQMKLLAASSDDQMTVFSVYGELVSAGLITPADALAAKTAFYKKKPKSPALAAEMVALARASAEDAPELAELLANSAKSYYGPVTRESMPAKKAFDDTAKSALQFIGESKDLKIANDLLAINPDNAEAHKTRADILLSRGDINGALKDLEASNHEHASLAQTTTLLLAAGNSAGAQPSLESARQWKRAADSEKNGTQASMRTIASWLYAQALASTMNPLDAFTKPVVQKELANIGGAKERIAEPTNDNDVETPVEPGAEPKRPEYVLKDAVWNPETGSWYYLSPDAMTFTEVMKLAAAHSATPVIVDDELENRFVYKMSEKPAETWLGLMKGNDGKLYKMDGQPATFENWHSGEGITKGEKYVHNMWGGKHADSYPDVKKARACLEWKYVPKTIAKRGRTK